MNDKKNSDTINFAKIPKDSQRVYHGVRFDVYGMELPTKSGRKIRRELIVHPGAVVILPILDDDRIVMIRNERFAIGQTLWELPAGTLEPNEPPKVTAGRELIEETGYQANVIEPLFSFYTTPGFCNELMYAFVAKDLKHIGQKLEESEKITVEALSWKEVLTLIQDGILCDGKTIATLLYYKTFNADKFQ